VKANKIKKPINNINEISLNMNDQLTETNVIIKGQENKMDSINEISKRTHQEVERISLESKIRNQE
jgi:fructose-bisphosphate aldolase class 1